jgi:predicted CxxxxCH...CXXCH cytochrome family protein
LDGDKASNAFLHRPGYSSGTAGDETSHFWGGYTTTQLAAGSTNPLTTFYYSRYSISKNRVTCSICHNPHGDMVTTPKLLRASTDGDLICQQCHVDFYKDYANAFLTHPVGSTAIYANALSAEPTKYNPTPAVAAPGVVGLVNGVVSCSSCHAPHFADSDSSTPDGGANVALLAAGDGHLLKADGPGKDNKSVLCQACHTYQEHGKVGNNAAGSGVGDVQIGCLVCHSGHSYDETAPNYFVLRKTVNTGVAGFGAQTTLYTSYPTAWGSYCGSCHDINNIPNPGLRGVAHSDTEDCSMCHEHGATSYSFGKASSGTACSSCHGAPPRTNIVADRSDNTVPDTGYAVGQGSIDYMWVSPTQNGKNETLTPHKRHAGALNDDKTAVDYAFGSGSVLSACLPCHNDKEDTVTPTHDKADSNGSFQDIYFNDFVKYNGLLSPLPYKMGNPNIWTCTGIYCHSNGGKRRTDGGAKQATDFKTAMTPSWLEGSTTNKIVGDVDECQQCHGEDRASMVLAQKNNSPTHDTHLLKLGDGKTKCYLCHSTTVDSTGTIPASARDHRFGGTHVNGTVNIVFSTTALNGDLAAGTYASGPTQGTCVVYCHSDAIGGPPALVPDWDFPTGTIVCGSCHGITSATLTSGSHPIHINSTKAKIKCSSCHGLNADTGTHSGHVDGAITKLTTAESCDLCHGVELASGKSWDASPTWGVAASADCRTCHTGSVLTSYVNTAAVTIAVTTVNNLSKALHESDGHSKPSGVYTITGKPAGAKNCTACHVMPTPAGTGHVDGLGTSKLLIGGFSCEACHTAAGSRSGEATVDVQSHGNQTAGYTKKAYNAAFTKTCLACHDPHGTSNGAMIENLRTKQNAKDATANFAGNVVFSSLTLTSTNSFDESDSGAGANNDDLCATCHSTTLHNNRAVDSSHHEGENCTTTCHGHNGTKGGFMPSNGTACNDCHGNPPTATDPRPPESVGAHAAHTSVGSHEPTEDKFDCAVCHQGGENFALDGAHSSAPLVAGIGYNAGDGTCSGACHLSTASDGYWNDPNGLDCASCHNNIVKPLSLTHNKHFAAGKVCIDCHTGPEAADAGAHPEIDLKRTHIDDHDAWSLDATNDGSVLADRGAATQDEATVIVTTWNDGANTCSNAACHNPSGLSNTATWGNTNAVGCDFCHSSTNPDAGKGTPGSHGAHMNAAGTFGITTIACTSCHPNNTLNNHLNDAVNLNGGFAYNASLTDYTSSTFGQCTTTTCHNDGRGAAVESPVWGRTPQSADDCTICHAAPPANGRHAQHLANTAYVSGSCGECHLNATLTTYASVNHLNTSRTINNKITGGTLPQCTNTCHVVDATGTWTDANVLDCIECHTSGKIGTAPASGLHVGPLTISANEHDISFKITRNEVSPSGTCTTCHPGINLLTNTPAAHAAGGAPVAAQAAVAANLNYSNGSPSTCAPSATLATCHDDGGDWSRKWNITARNSDDTQCGNCHGDFDRGWVNGVIARHAGDAQVEAGHDGTDKCYMCHTFKKGATVPYNFTVKHRDGSIQLNDDMIFTDNNADVNTCNGCHDSGAGPYGTGDGQYGFLDTNKDDTADGGVNRWGREMIVGGPAGNCNGCHLLAGRNHAGTNESATVHTYHTGSPMSPGCGACHPADSGPGGANHDNGTVNFGGTYLTTALNYTGADFTNTNCSSANGCHNSILNSWKTDSLGTGTQPCIACHASAKLLDQGGYPPTSNEHAAHTGNDAYVGTTATNDCDDCHGAGSSTGSHAATHSNGVKNVTNKVNNDYNASLGTCTNTCHNVVNGRDWTSVTTLDCTDCHSGTFIGKVNKNNISGLHQANVALAHDDAFPRPNAAPDGTCTSCHTTINLTTPASHVDGVTTDPNTAFGLFASYDTSAASTCSGAGVATNCHSDGGDWTRKWNNAVNAKPLPTDDPTTATVCRNCHGTFAQGWNSLSASHIDPDLDNTGDQMQAGGHLVCEKCHGWGNANYNRTWLGSSNFDYDGHGDGHITMNGPVPIGTGYNPATRGCDTINCHGASTLTLSATSGWTVNNGNFGGAGACGACHNDGHIPPDNGVFGAHAAHGADNDSDYSECEACHGTDNGGDWATGSGGSHNTGTVNFAVGITYSNSGTPGTDAAAANDTCTTTQCHSAAGNPATWGDSIGCNACHYYEPSPSGNNNSTNTNPLSATHSVHFNKGKICIDCHGTLPIDRTHIAAKAGTDGVVLSLKANAAQNDADPVARSGMTWDDGLNTCGSAGSLGCHNSKTTPAWGTTGIGCSNCHVPGGGAAADPASGLHNMTAANVQPHNGTLRTGCTECHASMTSDPATHIDGAWEADSNTNMSGGQPRFLSGTRTGLAYSEGAANSSTCWDNGASGAATSLDYNAGASCHRDNGVWKRLWSSNANVDTSSSKNPGQLVCDVCHGQYQTLNGSSQGWREGSVHYRSGGSAAENKGVSHNRTGGAPVANACDDCHAYPAASGVHENGALNFSGGAGVPDTFTLTSGSSGWYCATCHNANSAEVATLTSSHTFPDSTAFATRTYVVGTTQPEGGCTGCHGNSGTGGYWPDGSTAHAANDNGGGEHAVHALEIAKKLYVTGSPSIAQQNSTCNYCHPGNTHGGADGTLPADVSRTDSANDGSPDLELGTSMKRIVSPFATDTNGYWRRTPGTCSAVACHAGAPFTPHWYADTTAPGNVTLTAAVGPVPRSIKLTWTAPGDDGSIDGTAYKYDIRMGTTSGIATDFTSTTNYVQGVPTVKRMGSAQETIIHNVNPSATYYFSLRTYDRNVISDPNTTVYGTSNTASYTVSATPDTTAPVLTGSPSWYGLDKATVLDASGTVKLSWTRAEDHSMPITYDVFWSTVAIDYDTPQASTKDTSYRVTGLTNGQSYNFAVRAKDFYNNTDTNTITLQAIPQGLSMVPKTNTIYYANGTTTTNIAMQTAVHTNNATTSTLPAVFIGPTTFTANTTIFANSFSINVDNGTNPSTVGAELGYITGASTWNSFSPPLFATDQTVAKRAVRLVTFKFNGAQRSITSAMNAKLGVRISVSSGAIDNVGWGPTSKGGILSFADQPDNISPSVPTVTPTVTGSNVSFYWTASTDSADGVADTIHYDVYGSANGGNDGFPYVIATGLTTNATVGSPLVWDTQAAGIALSGSVTNVQVKVEAGDVINNKILSHTPSVPTNLTVDNSGDNVAPGAISNLKAETRPKQGAIAISWTAPGDDGSNNGRAASYDIRWSNAVIDTEPKFTTATPLVSAPYPDFGGNGQLYEALGLDDGTYYFAIKAVDEGAKTSPLAYTTATTAAGPKCGICHSTPPDEGVSIGNHAKHGYTMTECGNCHGTAAATFATDHQDGEIRLGWKTASPAVGVKAGYQITYTQGGQTIYQDSSPGGFNVDAADTGNKVDDGTCGSWSTLNVSGCHGPASSASWTAAATLVCSSCHGVPSRPLDNYSHSFDDPSDDVKSAPPIDNHGYDGTGATEAERKFVGAHVPHLNSSFRMSKGDSCRLCHGASRPGASTHADGIIDIKLDTAAAGATATWTPGTAITAGTCGSMDPSACHPSAATPKWDSNEVFFCTNCHGFGGTTPSHVTDPIGSNINEPDYDPQTGVGNEMPGNCTWCHVGGHPKDKKVTAITKASPAVVTTETNHNLATNDKVTIHTKTGMTEINNRTYLVTYISPTSFSLQGSNSSAFSTFDYGTWIEGNGTGIILVQNDSRVGINYLSGGIHLKANIGARGEVTSEAELCWSCHGPNSISEWEADSGPTNTATDPGNGNVYNFGTLSGASTTNWVGTWNGSTGTTATWSSGTTGTYGFGYKTNFIESTHSTDSTGTSALTGSAYNYSKGGVDVVGKIRCSNCHDVHNSNKSPLAGDGLDPSGAPYLRGTWKSNPYKEDGAPIVGQTYTASVEYGTVPRAVANTTNGMGGYWIDQNSGNPTAGWTYETSAGLCQLCHGTSVDALDQVTGENLWITTTNGHANSVLGGSGTDAANIFLQGVSGGRNGTIGALGGTAGVNPNVGGWMGFENTASSTTNNYGYGPRSAKGAYILPYQKSQVLIPNLPFAWGNAVDATTVEIGYHQFSCSKCHNPHASRLPKLMITNCLDVTHNTWDNSYTGDTSWSLFNSATSSWGTNKLSHLSTAQNCHRYIDINGDNTPDEKGWNKVTPW